MDGLTTAEVAAKQARGEQNKVQSDNGRSYADIIRTNLFSFFNNILYVLGALLIALGQTTDAVMSVGLAVLNAIIGTIQELRAKRQLDQVALLNRPEVIVLRDGRLQTIDPANLVLGDIIHLEPGEQATVDGRIVGDGVVEMDESLLTGEADLIRKQPGAEILSGSYCVTGHALYEAEKVGLDSYANQITANARVFQTSYTPLQRKVNFVVRLVMFVVAIMSVIIFTAALIESLPFSRLVEIATVLTGLVPYGLFTMIAVAYALGAATIAQKGALVQQTNAVESLSNVDVLCLDKTGTLTANRLQFEALFNLSETASLESISHLLGNYVRSTSTQNLTGEALAAGLPGVVQPVSDEIPFASVRKWSALTLPDGVFALGAVEMLADYLPVETMQPDSLLMQQAATWAEQGLRVLLFAHNPQSQLLHNGTEQIALPSLTPLALVSLRDELRPFATETLTAFTALDIQLKIISGDNPQTVAALARQAGLGENKIISGIDLNGQSPEALARIVQDTAIFGRISPEQKQALVEALIKQGHYVAMMGDGVNDVLSLKKAHVGIAMQSGSQATRNVADMVLLKDSFAALLPAFQEGQNIIGGLSRAMYLFLVRVFASALIIIAIAVMGLNFPFEPAQVALTLFTVGIPAFFLTLWSRPIRLPDEILHSLVRFTVPAALLTMLFSVAIYTIMIYSVQNRISQFDIPPAVVAMFESSTGLVYQVDAGFTLAAATIVAQTFLSVFISYSAFILLLFLEPPHRWFEGWTQKSEQRWPLWLTIGLWLIFTVVAIWEPLSSYFGLVPMPIGPLLIVWLVVLVWALLLRYLWRSNWLNRTLGMD